MRLLSDHVVTGDSHNFSWEGMMSLPIRCPPIPFYFRLSIIFLTLQILQRPPHQRDLLRPSCDHHQLYPMPITPLVQYHIGDLPYDLRTTPLHFPFLVSSLLPNAFFHGPTNHRSSHHTIGTLPYVLLHLNLILVLLIICIQDFCIYSKKEGSFPPELRLKLVLSHCFTLL